MYREPLPNESLPVAPVDKDLDPRKQARLLYWMGYRVARIAEMVGEKRATVHSWKRRDAWDKTPVQERIDLSIDARMMRLIAKENKEGKDYKEIDLLGRQLERTARVRKFDQTQNEVDLNPAVANRNSGPRRKPEKNAISDEAMTLLKEAFLDEMFEYQRGWYRAGQVERIRNILKSRQIGATYFFAREAFIDAITTGRNQIFLSASKAQAHVFRQYIVQFAKDVAGIELKGDPMVLPNGATLYFLGTNARTAQSYHGNLYFDEYFWVSDFKRLRKVASGMAIHAKWRQTYFSTPSTINHEAYPYWSGEQFNRGRAKDERIKVDISHEALSPGFHCADGQWRQIVTIEDAIHGGCNLFDIDQLRLEYSPEEYDNLLMCGFMDDTASVFPMGMLLGGAVDSWDLWEDFKPFFTRPFGNREVWVGYDPSNTGDSAALVVIAPPLVAGGKFRVLEREQFSRMDYEFQAGQIKRACDRYNVTYIGIDTTGIGSAVHQLVSKFRPDADAIRYDVATKTRMVLKALDLFTKRRVEFDAGWTDFMQSFMAIRKGMTASGSQVTYMANRSEEVSHADIAWAAMHAFAHEPFEGMSESNKSIIEISG
ncbi:MAG: terminase ATPase subunit family protein [Fluviibacter sp.]